MLTDSRISNRPSLQATFFNIARSAGPQWIFSVSDVQILNLSENFLNFDRMGQTLAPLELLPWNFLEALPFKI